MKTIIVTGSLMNEKSKELATKCAYRKPYQKEKTDAFVYNYPSEKYIKNDILIIITCKKEDLINLLAELNHTNYTIIDTEL